MGYSFSRFIGIDWSGSADYSRGDSGDFPIQVAVRSIEDGNIELIAPPTKHNPRWRDNRWSRSTLLSWLSAQIAGHDPTADPILVGLDFAFSFPYCDRGDYLPGHEPPIPDWPALCDLIAKESGEDYSPIKFVENELGRQHFMTESHSIEGFVLRRRETERSAHLFGETAASVFKLVGGDQVGRGAISGMACLTNLKKEFGPEVQVWPFEGIEPSPTARAVVVEVFPRILYEMIGVPPNSYRYPKVFRLSLQDLGVRSIDDTELGSINTPLGEDSADAIMIAASLGHYFGDSAIWLAPDRLARDCYHREGWIWGAGHGS